MLSNEWNDVRFAIGKNIFIPYKFQQTTMKLEERKIKLNDKKYRVFLRTLPVANSRLVEDTN